MSTSRKKNSDDRFPIVAIGASAGGLNAFQCFLGMLPRDFRFAVVFVQHLSPMHRSLLPDLIRTRRPDLDIYEITDGLEIRHGKIYLCPPGEEIKTRKGFFEIVPRPKAHLHLPIDEFLSALAEEMEERVIAVIFSGAGTDGARGIKDVRDKGGTVFVQDPATAEFTGMPLAAIGAVQTDGVFSPEDIAREILKLHGPDAEIATPGAVITQEEFETFFSLLYKKTGYRFNHYKKSVIARRIIRRMYLNGISSVRDYMEMLEKKDPEPASLASDLMIGVTSFFRDRLAWKALRTEVIRKIVSMRDKSAVRVWAPACATGEEAYSIAMLLSSELELAGVKREIQVFATDVNDRALEKARDGVYTGSVAADIQQDYMKKFFNYSEDGNSVIVSRELREQVVFAKHDILTDPPFSRLDLVICRNLLIYLEPEAQGKCISIFHYALKEGGYLFLGNAESVGRSSTLFKSLGHKKCRVYQKVESREAARLQISVLSAAERTALPPTTHQSASDEQRSVIGFVQETLLEEYAPAAVAINHNYDILYHSGPTNKYLRQPRGAPTQNFLDLISEHLRSRVRGAIYRVSRELKPISVRTSFPAGDDGKRQVTLRISKLGEDLVLIVFREKGGVPEQASVIPSEAPVDETVVRQLEGELSATRADLQSHIEQLKSLNEELQSSNEELQAANEELETSREELQSLNEELITVNGQLQSKIEEQEETNNDLVNFLTSTNIPTFFLDDQLRVKRFTPAMSRLIKLIPGDIGRPIIDMSQDYLGPDLISDARAVLDTLTQVRKEININDTWYIRTALPYRTFDNRIEGVVVSYNDITEIKQAEERTKHLASFPQLNPNPIIEVSASGKITFSNPATQQMLEDLGLGSGEASFFLPDDFSSILDDLKKNEESSFYREISLKDRVFGESIHLNPQFGFIRIYARDITAHKTAEEEIRASEERYRTTLDSLMEGCQIISYDWRYVYVNEVAASHGRLRREELLGHTMMEIYPGIEHTDMFARLRDCMESRRHFKMENLFSYPDGSESWFELSFEPVQEGIFILSQDITARKQAEAELRQSEERLLAVVRSTPSGLFVTRMSDGLFLEVNEALLKLIGYRAEEVIGQSSTGLNLWVDPEDRNRIVDLIREQGLVDGFEVQQRRKSGEIFYALASVKKILWKGETCILGTLTDITERKRAEEERESAVEFLRIVNESRRTADLIKSATDFFQEKSGCEAVGIRLHEEHDYPYYETRGFSKEFVQMESRLCSCDKDGNPVLDEAGNPVLACMCGNVICGRFDPAKPFFTKRGSFWSNCTTELLASTSAADRQARTRNRCNGEGYESVALIGLSIGKERIGLLQLNDRRKGRFTPELIALWERLADYLAVAISKFQSDEALRESQKQNEFLANILEISSQPFGVGYPDGRLGLVNKAFEELTGYTGDELRSIDWANILTPPEWREIEQKKLEELSITGKPVRYEKEYLRKDGTRVPIELLVHLVSDANGNPQYYYSFLTDITERKRAEEVLRQSEERYRTLFSTLIEGFCIIEVLFDANDRPIDYRFLEINPAFEAQTGLQDAQGKLMRELAPEHEAHWFELYGKVALTGEPARFVNEAKALNRWYDVSAYRVGGQDSRKVAILFNDITESKRADAELHANEEKLRLFIEHAPASLAMFDRDMRYISVSRRWLADYGLEGRDLVGLSHYEVFPEIGDGWKKVHQRGMAGEVVRADEDRFERQDGSVQWLMWEVRPWYKASSEVGGIVVFSEDITERKKSEEALRESQERLRFHIENSPMAIVEWDADFVVTRWAGEAEKMFGWSIAETVGRPIMDLNMIYEEDIPIVRKTMEKLTDGVSPRIVSSNRNYTKDRRIIHCEWYNSVLLDAQGKMSSVMSQVLDITVRKKAEEEVRRHVDELERFNKAMVGRELRMIELKKEVNGLCAKAGLPPEYSLDFDKDQI